MANTFDTNGPLPPPSVDDPAATGVDDDGTNEALGVDPLKPEQHDTRVPELDDVSGLIQEIPDPQEGGEEPSDPA